MTDPLDRFAHREGFVAIRHGQAVVNCAQRKGSTTVGESTYDSVLLVELTIILLYGQVKMDFVFKGDARSIALQFNTVMKRAYLGSIEDILIAIDGDKRQREKRDLRNSPILRDWPLKFKCALI